MCVIITNDYSFAIIILFYSLEDTFSLKIDVFNSLGENEIYPTNTNV